MANIQQTPSIEEEEGLFSENPDRGFAKP